MKPRSLLCGFGLMACALSASAQSVPILTLTEKSSTELSWSWGAGGPSGLLFSGVGGDNWADTIAGPAGLILSDGLVFTWSEGSFSYNAVTVHVVSTGVDSQLALSVTSDVAGVSETPNGFTEFSGQHSFGVAFFDEGDTVISSPDSGGAGFLLIIGCGALFFGPINIRACFSAARYKSS